MIQAEHSIYFYLPSLQLVKDVPEDVTASLHKSSLVYWEWIQSAIEQHPALLAESGNPCPWAGPYNWTIQTYLYLRRQGLNCFLTAVWPETGIIFAHTDMLSKQARPSCDQFIVELKPDRYLGCLLANFVIVQNKHDPLRGIPRVLVDSAYIPNWPQPGLLSRDKNRGLLFQNIRYMGNSEQFIPNVEHLKHELSKLGLSFKVVERRNWHDYRKLCGRGCRGSTSTE